MKNFTLILLVVFAIQGCKTKAINIGVANCDLAPDPGPCRAAMVKYYFDKPSGTCKEFIYGGCQGVVPFETKEDCEKCRLAK